MKYEKLLSPAKIGSLELKNRAIMAPMSAALGNPDGTVSDPLIAYLTARADGGVGAGQLGPGRGRDSPRGGRSESG